MQEPPPTDPTRRVVTRAPGEPVAAAPEVVYESELVERIDRTRFWATFGAIAAVLAAILGVIALVVALLAKDDANNSDGSTAGLRREVNSLQSDVASLKSSSGNDATKSDVQKVTTKVNSLEKQVSTLSSAQKQDASDISKIQTDLTDLTSRVDQVEKAQEQQAAGGP
jgi:septal ring factor EnvC (AmiA/AmiB activator)